MKLEIEFIPNQLRYSPFKRIFSREEWEKLKDDISRKNSGKCQICGEKKGIMSLDGLWSYNEEEHIQKLEGFIFLCEMCHYTKRLSRAENLAKIGSFDYNKLIEHYCKVNNTSRKEFEESRAKALEIFEKRSQYKWRRDLGKASTWKKKLYEKLT